MFRRVQVFINSWSGEKTVPSGTVSASNFALLVHSGWVGTLLIIVGWVADAGEFDGEGKVAIEVWGGAEADELGDGGILVGSAEFGCVVAVRNWLTAIAVWV